MEVDPRDEGASAELIGARVYPARVSAGANPDGEFANSAQTETLPRRPV